MSTYDAGPGWLLGPAATAGDTAGNVATVRMGTAARRLAPLSGLLLVAAVLCGLIVMHGLQPSPGPAPAPSVLAMGLDHDYGAGGAMSPDSRRHDGHGGSSHNGHAGGQVCLAFPATGAALVLLAVVTVLGGAAPASARPLLRRLPRGPTARPRGPTLAQLCVIRV
ncbi:DUF6153 family protein [Streptosporangium sp. NPDC049376]|uniref:DUF6153 family protein n=1 Tax=Streptosporangium sp. NPDC049376 TaxID=3366192 RepID=UPI00378FD726